MLKNNKKISPIEKLVESSIRCVKCDAKYGDCDCWIKCPIDGCSWFIEKGYKCRNPKHENK